MQCPNCGVEHLVRSERSGIATDYCPKCRTWLDHDKLEKQTKEDFNDENPAASVTDTRPPLPPDKSGKHG